MEKLKEQIHVVCDVIWSYLKDFDNKAKEQEATKKEEELRESAIQLVQKATKIKTRDIS